MEEEEERDQWLIGFGPIAIVRNVENEFVIVYNEGLIERKNLFFFQKQYQKRNPKKEKKKTSIWSN
jgi:hypothetical protein